jgi:dTMP kinase
MDMFTAQHDWPGRLIAVEGLDGSGKSTQIYLLKRWMESLQLRVFFTEWNSSILVRKATSKGKKRQLLTPATFSLIHATDFADRYERQIEPLLRAGFIVLADRYIYTAFARDAVRGNDPAWIRGLYAFAAPPALTFYFRVPPEVSLGRILEGRPQLKYFEAGMDMGWSPDPYESFRIFQGRIHDEYERLARESGFIVMDASRDIETQQKDMRAIVEKHLDLASFRMRSPRRPAPIHSL